MGVAPRVRAGGIAGLVRFLREHEDAVEADLQRFYGVDYLDRWRGQLSLRKIRSFLRHLPSDSACGEALRDGAPDWTLPMSLLDDIRMTLSSDGKRKPKPHPLRPTGKAKPTRDPRKVDAFKRRAARARAKAAARQA